MRFIIKNNIEDLIDYTNYLITSKEGKKIGAFILIGSQLIALLLSIILCILFANILPILILVSFDIVFLCISEFNPVKYVAKQYYQRLITNYSQNDLDILTLPKTIKLDQKKICIATKYRVCIISKEMIVKIIKQDAFIEIIFNDKSNIILPRRCFTTIEDYEKCFQLLST
jgi:hypothetical protein